MSSRILDRERHCPDCGERGGLKYTIMPPSELKYQVGGVGMRQTFGETRDYSCWNCDCEFILVKWEDAV